GLFLKEFILGDPVFCVRGLANCPNFGFVFSIEDPSKKHLQEPAVQLNSRDTFDLVQEIEYKLNYEIWNWDGAGESFSNTELTFSDELQTGAIEIEPASVTLGLLEVDTSTQGTPITITPIIEASSVELKASLRVNRADAFSALKFRVLAKNTLKATVTPKELAPNALNNLLVSVVDEATSEPIENALIKISLAPDFSTLLDALNVSSSKGTYFLQVPPLSAGQKVFLKAEAFNFNPSKTIELPVSTNIRFSDAGKKAFDCIEISPKELIIPHKEKANFKINSNACQKPVEFYLYQPFAGEPLTIENLKNLSVISNNNSPNLELKENDNIEVRVNADKFLGEYEIIIRAKFKEEQEFRDIERLTILVNPKSVSDGYCFEIDKTSFFVNPKDSGKISNNCKVKTADPFYPLVALGTPNASLNPEHQKLFPEQSFKWSTQLYGSLGETPNETRQVNSRLEAPIESEQGEQIPRITMKDVLIQSLTQACALFALFGGANCLNVFSSQPQIALLAIQITLSQNMKNLLGTQTVDQTCSSCRFKAESGKQTLLLGTEIESASIKDITFDEGGYILVNGKGIEIPAMGPLPKSILEQQESGQNSQGNLAQNQNAPALATGLAVFQLPFGQGIGGFPNPLELFSQFFNNEQQQVPGLEPDSCTGYKIESTNCSTVEETQNFSGETLANVYSQAVCTTIENAPIDIKDKTVAGINDFEMLVCNKYNEGYANVTFEIKDFVQLSNPQADSSFVPLKDTASDTGNVSERMNLYLDKADPNAFLKLKISNDSGGKIESWLEENGNIKSIYFEDSEEFGNETGFEIKNLNIQGEEFALITIEDFASDTFPAQLDMIYLVDTSNSMKAEKETMCQKIEGINSEISNSGIDALGTVYAIGRPDESIPCASQSAGWGETELIKDDTVHDEQEAWGPALQDALAKHSWREGAKKAAVIFSDTGPLGTQPPQGEEQPKATTDAQNNPPTISLQNAIEKAKEQGVKVFAMFGIPFEKGG
ncbi:MAG: hypothetical protein HYW50_00155, partial [Candidatus Diapherotrites archaeon]|nr:hypothetical protein [Candidatus Diapherotrites archaeon]